MGNCHRTKITCHLTLAFLSVGADWHKTKKNKGAQWRQYTASWDYVRVSRVREHVSLSYMWQTCLVVSPAQILDLSPNMSTGVKVNRVVLTMSISDVCLSASVQRYCSQARSGCRGHVSTHTRVRKQASSRFGVSKLPRNRRVENVCRYDWPGDTTSKEWPNNPGQATLEKHF